MDGNSDIMPIIVSKHRLSVRTKTGCKSNCLYWRQYQTGCPCRPYRGKINSAKFEPVLKTFWTITVKTGQKWVNWSLSLQPARTCLANTFCVYFSSTTTSEVSLLSVRLASLASPGVPWCSLQPSGEFCWPGPDLTAQQTGRRRFDSPTDRPTDRPC